MSQAIKSNLFLYADDTCLVCQQKDINEIKKRLNKNFESICDRFVDNKLSIHFGNEKTKSILFAIKFKIKKVRKLNIKYGNIQIKQHSKVKYLGCMLQSGAKIVRLIVKKELSGSPSPNINVGYEFKGRWTSLDLYYIDMGEEGENWVVSRIFAPDCLYFL